MKIWPGWRALFAAFTPLPIRKIETYEFTTRDEIARRAVRRMMGCEYVTDAEIEARIRALR